MKKVLLKTSTISFLNISKVLTVKYNRSTVYIKYILFYQFNLVMFSLTYPEIAQDQKVLRSMKSVDKFCVITYYLLGCITIIFIFSVMLNVVLPFILVHVFASNFSFSSSSLLVGALCWLALLTTFFIYLMKLPPVKRAIK